MIAEILYGRICIIFPPIKVPQHRSPSERESSRDTRCINPRGAFRYRARKSKRLPFLSNHFFMFILAPPVWSKSVRPSPHTLYSHIAAAPALKSPEAAQPHPPTSSRFLRLLPIPAEPRIELSSHSAQCKASGLSDPSPRSGSDEGPSFQYQRSRCSSRCQGHYSEQGCRCVDHAVQQRFAASYAIGRWIGSTRSGFRSLALGALDRYIRRCCIDLFCCEKEGG
jgi:hypothetical protein